MIVPFKNIECRCGELIKETHPTCGEGWNLCETCKNNIIESICQDIPFYCQHCHKPLTDKDYIGDFNLVGDPIHMPGPYWVFKHISNIHCERWSRCHSSEKKFIDAYKEIAEQRETMEELDLK